VLIVLLLAALGGYVAGRSASSKPQPASPFSGRVASLYPDRTGGCVAADPGQGVETAADANCGPIYVLGSDSVRVGTTVRATAFSMRGADDQDVSGLLLDPH
jgi:hypothetical protein